MINFKVWLTALLVTSGVWVVFESGARATSSGTGTAGNISITQNGTVITDSITNPIIGTNNNTSVNPTNLSSNGGSIVITTGNLILVRKVPEPSVLVGILAVAGTAVSRLKNKRKS